ncbi:hypothetical protein J7355_13060 [Endozoicomonas sp. G2_2]|uniref:hypothetical protein n=1 Tax=Endozoicomonas sp. G2_2 TaxID=2821092 RepID=UPI001ADCE339|nr:hypothetical protein [Endozoicomonas sp. G2_2]MBO9471023.1 hypothetical protein [Endozoicomonas sp. G2_2]
MAFRYRFAVLVAPAMLLSACVSSPYLDPPAWLTAENSPVWTSADRSRFVDSIEPGETTLGDVVAMYGPAMAYSVDASGGEKTSDLFWYGETGFDQPWASVVVPGGFDAWSASSPVLAVQTSEGVNKRRAAAGVSAAEVEPPATAAAAEPSTPPQETNGDTASSAESARSPAVEDALADGVIGPGEINNDIAAAMAAFGQSGGTVSSFRARFGPEAEYDEDTRLFRKVGATLFYGSEYGGGPSVWVEFDGDNRYESTMIHVPRGGDKAPYERFF